MNRLLFLLFTLWLSSRAEAAVAWPQFRGLQGSGVTDGELPAHFGPGSNELWRVTLATGHSSPVIWNDRIFLTGFASNELLTLCLSRSNGAILWQRAVSPGTIERGHRNGNPATSTPCTDGTNVYAYFGCFGVVAYDFAGRELWRRALPTPITQHGASSSPVLAGGLVLLQRDADVDSHLLALHSSDGRIVWRVDRPDARRSFSTPLVLEGAQLAVVVPGTLRVATYEVTTGRELWTVRGLPNEMCASPVAGNGLIFVAGWTMGVGNVPMVPYDTLLERGDTDRDGKIAKAEAPDGPAKAHFTYIDADKDNFITRREWTALAEIFSKSENALLAIRPDGQGDVTGSHVAWKQTRGLPYVPTPLLHQGRVWLVKNGGLLSCFNATNGSAFFQEERVGALGDYYASPVAAGNRVCLFSQQGVGTVVEVADELKVLGRNPLGVTVLATPALAENTLYVRTAEALHAFRARP